MLNKLVFASLLGFGVVPASEALARAPVSLAEPRTVLSIDQRVKAGMDISMEEYHFELHADGTWSFVKTLEQSILNSAKGKLSPRQMRQVRRLLDSASWKVTTDAITCMAFAAVNTEYKVDGVSVWTDEMCSGQHLDRASSKRLAQILKIVNPLMA